MNVPLHSALAVSLLVHALLCVWVEVRGKPAPRVSTFTSVTSDHFFGNGIELESIPVEHAEASAALAGAEGKTTTPAAQAATASDTAATTDAARPPTVEPPRDSAANPPKAPPAPDSASAPERPRARPTKTPAASTASSGERTHAPASAAAADARASGAASATNAAGASAPYGAVGLPPGVRHLPRAFTRALALANRGDTRWREVAPGRVGEAHLRLAVDSEGQLGELEYASEAERDRLAPVVQKLFSNTLLLLKNGRFSVDPRTLSAGVTRLRVTVEVTDGGPPASDGDPVELFGLATAAPEPGKPGKSGFVLNSGRQVTAWVWIE
jgi:hypothetical protein